MHTYIGMYVHTYTNVCICICMSAYTHIYVTILRDAGWIGGLTKVAIYPTFTNRHQKIAVLTAPIPGLSGSRVVSYPVTHEQLKQTKSGYLR